MPPTDTEVAVVGAGAAGLAAAAALAHTGVDPVVLEADERVGGTWARRYDRLRLHTVRRFSGLPYRPLPKSLPKYVSKDEYARYLADYAEALGLDVRLRHPVERIDRDDGAWLLRGSTGDVRARAVVVATGKHARPWIPPWPGLDEFAGRVVHSADYRSGREYAGERVLVAGIGNSGAEIATDLVEQAALSVAISVRTPPPIVRRDMLGVPVQLLGMLLAPFPPRPVDRVAAVARRVGTGDLGKYGIGKAAWGPFEARRPPVIDVGFLATLKRGGVSVRPGVERFTRNGVVFADGREEPFDSVVAATGFSSALPELIQEPEVLDERGLPPLTDDGSSGANGLYFIGFRESPRGTLYEAKRDSRRLAAAVAAYVSAS